LAGLQATDPQAWQKLAQLYAPLVYRWCRSRGLQAADTEDVVQEVFRTIHARLPEFRRDHPGGSFRGWLWTITWHKLGDFFRRSSRPGAQGSGPLLDGLAAVEPPPAEAGGLYRRAIALVRDEFEEHTWQAFWRVVVEERAPAVVAEELQLSVNAVYLAKSRVLRRLREALGDAD
jgi:RNA polymerase sigma-70 factor (ECF subfamily)